MEVGSEKKSTELSSKDFDKLVFKDDPYKTQCHGCGQNTHCFQEYMHHALCSECALKDAKPRFGTSPVRDLSRWGFQ